MTATSKAFQEATVAAAKAALQGGNPQRRFLVADEVGLGKTVVARDTIAAMMGNSSKFNVYYITSGLRIADQNKVELLRFLDVETAKRALSCIDRVGLIPFDAPTRDKLRLYAFTPKTSFPGSQRLYGGRAVERAFIKSLLNEIYPRLSEEFPEGFFEQGATTGWRAACDKAKAKLSDVPKKFITAYGQALRAEFKTPARAKILCAVQHQKPSRVLGIMRKALAHAALEAAPPDLVIFDEFQCYRDLLTLDDANPLARQLLLGKNGDIKRPLLLLSATPYRFYAEKWETGAGVAPHAEFFDLIEFLGGQKVRTKAEEQFKSFGDRLHSIGALPKDSRSKPVDEAKVIKTTLEQILTPLMSRTERPATQDPSDFSQKPAKIVADDLSVFRHFTENVDPAHASSTVPYWLSVPLPAQALGNRYQISKNIAFPATRGVPRLGATNCFKARKDGWGSAKLRELNTIVPTEALALPWVKPSLPWWKPAGPWANVTRSPKILIFSRFRATPQSLAALVSLEVERRYVGKENKSYKSAWKRRHLNPKPKQGPTLALFHPSPFLIKFVNPLDVQNNPSLKQLRKRVRQQIIQALPKSIAPQAPSRSQDGRQRPTWAVLAAIERASDGPGLNEFANIQNSWNMVPNDDAALKSLIEQRENVEQIDWVSTSELHSLVEMALGAPGVVAGRALYRHLPELFNFDKQHYQHLLKFCWLRLRPYLDRPVFWSVLPGKDAAAKYQNACIDGCLEAVLDEHFWLRKSKIEPDFLIDDLYNSLAANIGTFGFNSGKKAEKIRIRCHAAVPFGGTETLMNTDGSEESRPVRSEAIRSAFNTPFWPYILATTSVGQEGLDFHSWCVRLGHWDLCSSPVDLEQREGRIQRFGGLTVRQPLADNIGRRSLHEARGGFSSPWDIIATIADAEFSDESGMSPWWTVKGAALKRHLFSLQQSRDVHKFERLRSQRLLYRLALGQPDQEDLVDMLTNDDAETAQQLQELTLNLSAFSHKK